MTEEEGVVTEKDVSKEIQSGKEEESKRDNNNTENSNKNNEEEQKTKSSKQSKKITKSDKLFTSKNNTEENEKLSSNQSGIINTHHSIIGSSIHETEQNINKSNPIVINDLRLKKPIIKVKFIRKKKPLLFKISFIYKRNEYELMLKPNTTFAQFQDLVCEKINLQNNEIEIRYQDKLYKSPLNDNDIIEEITKNEKFPFFDIRKIYKPIGIGAFSIPQPKLYSYKVIIDNISSIQDLYQKIDDFFTDGLLTKDYLAIPLAEKKYSIGFAYPDLAFDFNRYMLILKGTNELYHNIKLSKNISIQKNRIRSLGKSADYTNMSQPDNPMTSSRLKKSPSFGIRNIRHPMFNSALYAGISGPYLSYEEMRRKEYIESKKKWINKKGFISSVSSSNKYYNNKYIY